MQEFPLILEVGLDEGLLRLRIAMPVHSLLRPPRTTIRTDIIAAVIADAEVLIGLLIIGGTERRTAGIIVVIAAISMIHISVRKQILHLPLQIPLIQLVSGPLRKDADR